ncbi:unnamed protein product [Didymodactylos carnosus]|uniref:Uncharacterized protein n=1 Tax=Didymodactylos carnosus TaxID=1234261 RepID=A0A8S2T0K0_9BILA|nr:unnamed protein product [Didymodactylos carnosus]CAF4254990.1 unnamed protein product [Didymodactylos carnosus]
MSTIPLISHIIPKYKDQLKFLSEREPLFSSSVTTVTTNDTLLSNILNDLPSFSASSVILPTTTSYSHHLLSNFKEPLSKEEHINALLDDMDDVRINDNDSFLQQMTTMTGSLIHEKKRKITLPENYPMPALPSIIEQAIETGDFRKFDNYCNYRSVVVDAIFHDLHHKYELLYPEKRDYDNVQSWKNSLQTKFKKGRKPLALMNEEVKRAITKYSHVQSGRKIKKQTTEEAERQTDRFVVIQNIEDEDDVQGNIEFMREELSKESPDIDRLRRSWRITLKARRDFVSQNKSIDILKEYPGYRLPNLILYEIELLTRGLDIVTSTKECLNSLGEKLYHVNETLFVAEPVQFRVIKILCKKFEESHQHILCGDNEPSSPYPCLTYTDHTINVMLDRQVICSETRIDQAIALWMATYHIFEIKFQHHNRAARLLYCMILKDKSFATSTVRQLLNELNINIEVNVPKITASQKQDLSTCPIAKVVSDSFEETGSTNNIINERQQQNATDENVENDNSNDMNETENTAPLRASVSSLDSITPTTVSTSVQKLAQ